MKTGTNKVIAIAVQSCAKSELSKHQFRRKGLAGCGINLLARVGAVFDIDFWIFNDGSPPLSAKAVRSVVVAEPCPSADARNLCKGSLPFNGYINPMSACTLSRDT